MFIDGVTFLCCVPSGHLHPSVLVLSDTLCQPSIGFVPLAE